MTNRVQFALEQRKKTAALPVPGATTGSSGNEVVSSRVQTALKARETRQTRQNTGELDTAVPRNKVQTALAARNAGLQSSASTAIAGIQQGLNTEISTYNSAFSSEEKTAGSVAGSQDRIKAIEDLRLSVNAWREYMPEGAADEILDRLVQMEQGWIFNDIQTGMNTEIEAYNSAKPVFGNQEETTRNQSASRANITQLKDTINARRDILPEGTADEMLAVLGQMERGYDTQLQMASFGSQVELDAVIEYLPKYQGKTSAELKDIADGMSAGKEKDWINQYITSVEYGEKSKYNVATGESELAQMKKDLSRFSELRTAFFHIVTQKDWSDTREEADALIAEYTQYVSKYFGSERIVDAVKGVQNGGFDPYAELQKLISEKEAYLADAQEIQTYERYMALMGKADFSELSEYVKQPRTERSNTSILMNNYSDEASGWDDPLYEAINGNAEAQAWLQSAGSYGYSAGGANPLGSLSGQVEAGKTEAQHMTDEEVAVYNYLYKKEGIESAREYYSFLQNALWSRQRAADEEYWKKQASESPVMNSLFSVTISPLKVLSAAGQVADYIVDGKVNENASYNRYSHVSSAIREQVASDIAKSGKWGEVGSWTYQLGMSTGDFLMNSAVSGGSSALSLTLMGSGAMADTVIAAKDRGLSDDQAMVLGLVAGGAEVITEKLSIDALFKGDMTKGAMKYILTNALTEGTEEVGSSLINTFADILVSKDKSEWAKAIAEYMEKNPNATEQEAFQKVLADTALSLGLDFLGGSLMGGAMGTGGATINYAFNASPNLQANKDALAQYGNNIDALIQEGLQYDPDSRSYDLAQYYQKQTDKGKALTGYQIRNLLAANQDASAKKTIRETALSRLTELGATGETANRTAELITQFATGQKLSGEQKRFLENSPYAAQLAQEIVDWVTGVETFADTVTDEPKGVSLPTVEEGDGKQSANVQNEIENGGVNNVSTERESAGPAVAQAAGEQAGAGVLYGGSQRNDGPGTGEQTGSLAGSPGQRQSAERINASRAAVARQNLARSLRLEKVSSLDLGLASGTEAKTVQVIPQEHWDEEMSQLETRIYNETGKHITFVVGRIQVKGTGGGVSYVRGVINGEQIIVQADNFRATMEQIADHEVYHAKVDFVGQRLNEELRRHIIDAFSEEQFRAVLDEYIKAMRGVIDVTGNMSAAEYESAVRQIEEELFADAYAGINAFGAGADQFTETVNEKMDELYLGKAKAQDNGTAEPTGPPAEQSAAGAERFSADEDVPGLSLPTLEDPDADSISVNDIVTAGNGRLAVNINSKESGLHKHRKGEWPALVSNMIRNALSGKSIIAEDGDIITVTRRGAKEVGYGTDTKKLKEEAQVTNDYSKVEQKMITAEHAASIIALSRYSSWSANTEDPSDMFKRDGLNYRTVDIYIDGDPHIATVVTALNADPNQTADYGEKFYDIEGIEKQTNTPASYGTPDVGAVPHKIKMADSSSDKLTIAQKNRIVNRKNVAYSTGDSYAKTAVEEAFSRAKELRYSKETGEGKAEIKEKYSIDDTTDEDIQAVSLPSLDTYDQSLSIDITPERIEDNIRSVSEMQPVTEITGGEFAKGEVDLVRQVEAFFEKYENSVFNESLGEVTIDRRGIKSDISHGIGRKKAAAFAAVPDVIQKGYVVDYQRNWKNRGYDTAVVAAAVTIGGEKNIVGAVIIRSRQNNRFYLHEVLTMENGALPFKTGALKQGKPGGDAPSILSILERIRNVKANNVGAEKYSVDDVADNDIPGLSLPTLEDLDAASVDDHLDNSRQNGVEYSSKVKKGESADYDQRGVQRNAQQSSGSADKAKGISAVGRRDRMDGRAGTKSKAWRDLNRRSRDLFRREVESTINKSPNYEEIRQFLATSIGKSVQDMSLADKTAAIEAIAEQIYSDLAGYESAALAENNWRMLGDIAPIIEVFDRIRTGKGSTERYSMDDTAEQQAKSPKKATKPVAESKPIIAKRDLRNTMLNLFSVPDGQRAELGDVIDVYADRLLKNGSITEADRKAFFDRMYDSGVMTVPAEEYWSEARSHIAKGRIYVNQRVKQELGDDWNDLRRRAFAAGVYLVNDPSASGIDQWNATLAEQDMLPGLFDPEDTDQRAILERIVQVAEEGRDEQMSLAEYTAMLAQQEYVSEAEILDNMERQMDWALRTFAEKAKLEIHLRDRTGVKIAQERQQSAEKMTMQRAKDAQRWAEERQERKEMAQRQRERKELRELQQKTMKQLRWLSKNRYRAPEELQATWDEVLGDIDLYAVSAANEMHWSEKHQATWKDLAQMYKDAQDYDPNFLPSEDLKKIVDRLDATKIADLDIDALQNLYKAAVRLRTEFYNRNNVINDEMHRLFAEVYTDAKVEIESAPGAFKGTLFDIVFNLGQLTPMNVLQRMGGWDPDGVFYSMARQLEKGERDMRAFTVKAKRMLQEFLNDNEDWVRRADGQGKDAVWYELEVPELLELHMGDKPIFGDTVKVWMTPAQKVHMYLESKNVDNLRHMTGGRTFANKDLYSEGKRQEAFAQGKTIRLAPETVKQIVSDLTAEEMELARLLEQYYNSFATQEINKVSNILYGYDKAMGSYYAPIYTDRNYTKKEFGVFDETAEGVGNLKGRIPYSKNPSYNIGAFDAFERHVDQTARFCGMAIPARNWKTLMNWRVKNTSMEKVISNKWGDEGAKYIEDLITTLQAGDELKEDKIVAKILRKTVGKLQDKYISAVFGANPGIVLKQLGSIPLASAYLGVGNVPSVKQIASIDRELIAKYTQDLAWRLMGYSMPETKFLKDNPNWTERNKFYSFTFGGGAITAMDGWAASTLWPWAENKVRKEHPELEVGTQVQIDAGESAFYKKVAEEFENAVARSQSTSDEIHQSVFRKSKNPIARAFTLFRSDSAQTYNAIRQKIGEAQYAIRTGKDDAAVKAAKTAAGAVFGAMLLNAVWSEAVSFLMALWKNKGKHYRDDEDELTAESVLGEMATNVFGSIAGTVAGGEELFEAIGNILTEEKWYGIDTPGIEQLNEVGETIIEACKGLRDLISGAVDVAKNGGNLGTYFATHKNDILGQIKDVSETVAMNFKGLPVANVEAYLVGAFKWISPEFEAAYDDLWSSAGKSDLSGLTGGALTDRIDRILKDRNIQLSSEALEALTALYEAGEKTAVPADVPGSVTIGETTHKLGAYQQQAYSNVWSNIVSEALEDIVTSQTFAALDSPEQAKVIDRLYGYATARTKDVLFDDYELPDSAVRIDKLKAAGLDDADCFMLIAQNADVDDYLELAGNGIDSEEAYDFVIRQEEMEEAAGEDGLKNLDKWRLSVDFFSDADDQLAALSMVMSDAQMINAEVANDFGVKPDVFVTFYEERVRYDADGNGSYNQSEIKATIDAEFKHLSNTQKATLWQIFNSSAKNNPYSQAVGQRVLDAKAAMKNN